MVETKTTSSEATTRPAARAAGGRSYGPGYIAPHPSIRKDAVDVDSFLQEHQVYTQEYLDSVQPVHRNPAKLHELVAWYWHVTARTMVGLLTGTVFSAPDYLTETSLAQRMLFFTSVGLCGGFAGAVYNHLRSMVWNKPDNGWVHTELANAEAVRTHGGILAMHTRPPLPARLTQLLFQVFLFFQLLLVYAVWPSLAHAYEAYRAEEQVFNLSQAIRLIDSGRFKGWRSSRAPGLAVSYYGLQGDAPLREALLRMRADEACIHHLNIVLADLRPGDRNPFITVERKSK
ncbi:hypothetical protein ABPG77_009637 [Micractinium sp. CCAP 211/92]